MIYFAEHPDSSTVKIGFTAGHVKKRLANLQFQYGILRPLKLMGTMPGGKALERKIHRILSYYRAHGEWFSLHENVRAFISTCIETRDAELARAVHYDAIPASNEACDHYLYEWDAYHLVLTSRGKCGTVHPTG